MAHESSPDHHIFEIDLTREEARRRAEMLAAMGPDWDPVAVMAAEDEAFRLLYSGLDEGQQETYDRLVAAGVLPARPAEAGEVPSGDGEEVPSGDGEPGGRGDGPPRGSEPEGRGNGEPGDGRASA